MDQEAFAKKKPKMFSNQVRTVDKHYSTMSAPQSFAHDMADTVKDGSNAGSVSGVNSV